MTYVLRFLFFMFLLWGIRQGVAYLRRRLVRVPGPESTASPWEVLGLQPGAQQDAVEEAWRGLIQENHPDRVSHMDPEIQALAARRTQAINEAYEALRKR